MAKRIVIYYPDGREQVLAQPPTWQELQALVGGYVEQVSILERVSGGVPCYTRMYVNESGLINGLPRNDQATELYQREARLAYPDAANPFLAAKAAFRATLPPDVNVLEMSTSMPGYEADPYICGPAIVFEGWTREEVDHVWNCEE